MSFGLFFDIIFACLLLATIVFAVLLNRKLSLIHNSREELQDLLDHFSKSLARAEDGIIELKKAANSIGDGLDEQIQKSAALKDDLIFLLDRGENLATRLEDGIRQNRTVVHGPTLVSSTPEPAKPAEPTSVQNIREAKLTKMLGDLR